MAGVKTVVEFNNQEILDALSEKAKALLKDTPGGVGSSSIELLPETPAVRDGVPRYKAIISYIKQASK